MALKKPTIADAVKSDIEARSISSSPRRGDFPDVGKMDTFSIRLSAQDRDILRAHFDRRGLKLTQGIRMIINDYMAANGLK